MKKQTKFWHGFWQGVIDGACILGVLCLIIWAGSVVVAWINTDDAEVGETTPSLFEDCVDLHDFRYVMMLVSKNAEFQKAVLEEYESKDIQQNYIDLSPDQIYDFAVLVTLEGGGEPYECQKAIASVVVNRMTTQDKTFDEVLNARNQFEVKERIPSNRPNRTAFSAVMEVCKDGPSIPEYVTFFRCDYYFDWGPGYSQYCKIGNTYFTYSNELKAKLESKNK